MFYFKEKQEARSSNLYQAYQQLSCRLCFTPSVLENVQDIHGMLRQ